MKEYKKMALKGCLTLIVLAAVAGLAIYGAISLIMELING